jgi:hypothetical protein
MSRIVSSSQRGPIGSEMSAGITQRQQDLAVEGGGGAFSDLVGQREEAVAEQAHGQERDDGTDLVEAKREAKGIDPADERIVPVAGGQGCHGMVFEARGRRNGREKP